MNSLNEKNFLKAIKNRDEQKILDYTNSSVDININCADIV
jgi:hypothetical protein